MPRHAGPATAPPVKPIVRPRGHGTPDENVIACDKREAFAQGSKATKQSIFFAVRWIASRSLSSGAHSRDLLARNDDLTYLFPFRFLAGFLAVFFAVFFFPAALFGAFFPFALA